MAGKQRCRGVSTPRTTTTASTGLLAAATAATAATPTSTAGKASPAATTAAAPTTRASTTARKRSSSMPAPIRVARGLTSRFLIDLKGAKAFRYDVNISFENTYATQDLFGRISGSQGRIALYRALCRSIFKTWKKKNTVTAATVYDNATLMYASRPLKVESPQRLSTFEVDQFVRANGGAQLRAIVVSVSANREAPELQLKIIPKSSKEEDPNAPLRTFLNLCTSEHAVDSGEYFPASAGRLYSTRNLTEVGEGIVLRHGLAKGVSIVENDGHPMPCVDIEVKSSPFFKEQTLERTATEIHRSPMSSLDFDDIADIIYGLAVQPIYRRNKSFKVGPYTTEPLDRIPLDSTVPRSKTIVDYFRDTYNINLQKPHWVGVRPAHKSDNCFPLEVLQILPGQIVPLEKMSENLSKATHRHNNVPPKVRFAKMLSEAKSIYLFDQANSVLNAFGVSVRLDSNDIKLEMHVRPKILYKQNREATMNPSTAAWQSGREKYVVAQSMSSTSIWAYYYPKKHQAVAQEFLKRLKETSQSKNVFYATAKLKECPYENEIDFFKNFEQMVPHRVEFVLYVDSKTNTESHSKLKLAENLYKILTQQVTIETIYDVVRKNQRLTLENIIAKSNSKFDGLNYGVQVFGNANSPLQLSAGNLLIFGMDVAHPKQPTLAEKQMLRRRGVPEVPGLCIHPSVVGICANIAKNPEIFSGGYFYHGSKVEQVDTQELEAYVLAFLHALRRNRPAQSRPANVLILRDGLSQGQYKMTKINELNTFRKAFATYDAEWQPHVSLVVTTKRHLKRIYETGNNEDDECEDVRNPVPYTLSDQKFARYGSNEETGEDFAVPHRAIKGTAKPLQIETLVNNSGLRREELVRFVMSLSYHHQIVNSPTSLPQPVFQADTLATRGNNVYAAYRYYFTNELPYKSMVIGQGKSQRTIDVVDPDELNKKLSVRDTKLMELRFTS